MTTGLPKRLLLLATTTGYQTRAFTDAAAALGVELVYATDRCDHLDDPWRDGAIAIRFHDEARAIAAIVEASRARPIDGVLAVGDRPTVIAAGAAAALGLPWHAPEAAGIARHKLLTLERLAAARLPVPWHLVANVGDDPRAIAPIDFPCVVKPVALSGSRGVIRADDRPAFIAAFERLRAILRAPEVRIERTAAHDVVLIEGFIPGREFAIEGLMHQGALQVLAIFDKPDPLDGPFFEETIYVTPSSAAAAQQAAIVQGVTAAAAAIGLSHGPIHAECRVSDAGVFVLEVAARPIGGICARALRFDGDDPVEPTPSQPSPSVVRSRGTADDDERRRPIALEELLVRQALGEDPRRWRREALASGVMMIPIPRRGIYRGVEGVEDAKRVESISDVRITAKPDQRIVPLPEGASYLGFIFARAAGPAAVERALRSAHARLSFRIDAELAVLGDGQIQYNSLHG
jgi:hypothetical protein